MDMCSKLCRVIGIITTLNNNLNLNTRLLIFKSLFISYLNYCSHIWSNTKDFPKERYNTYAKSCNSNFYTKYPGATYSGLLLGTMRCL